MKRRRGMENIETLHFTSFSIAHLIPTSAAVFIPDSLPPSVMIAHRSVRYDIVAILSIPFRIFIQIFIENFPERLARVTR